MAEPLLRLFSSDGFMPHGHCYLWNPRLVWLHVISDALTAVAYISIPFTLVYFVRNRKDLPFNWIFLCFGMFIISCGATHAMEVWTLWNPTYWLAGVVKAVTAAASVSTAVLLVRLMPKALAIPTEQQLSKAREDLRQAHVVLEFAPDAIVVVDEAGKMIRVNAQTERLFGYDRSELLGRSADLLVPQRYRDQHPARRAEYLKEPRNRAMGSGLDLYGVKKDGTEVPIEISLSPIQTQEGLLVASAIRDITERKKSERTEQRLAQEEVARVNAEAAVAVRDDFVATAGHELRTPLAALLMQVQSLQRLARKGPVADLEQRLEKAARNGLRLDKLVSQLLDVSRIAAGRLQLEAEPFNLADLVRDVVGRFTDANEEASLAVTVRVDAEEKLTGFWDRLRVEQVVTNVVSNAIKYGRGRPVEVELELSDEGRDAVIRVIDHGIGIDPDQQKKIFERFERAASTREFGGFGLGLWISRQIVELSGGKIEVESVPSRGSTFTIRLPLKQRESVDVES